MTRLPTAALALACLPHLAQGHNAVRAQYTKYEYCIPMRDGKRRCGAHAAAGTIPLRP